MKRLQILALSLVALVVTAAEPASAAFISYTNEAVWLGAVGPLSGTEDFNSFVTDTSFIGVSVALNNMSVIGTSGANGVLTQKIDALALEFTGFYDIDGTAQLLADLQGSVQNTRFNFTNAVTAWGADMRGAADVPRDTRIHVYDSLNNLLGTVFMSSPSGNNTLQFYGFQITGGAAASYIVFTDNSDGNDVFGLDNIGFVTSNNEVPEPTSLVLFGIGACSAAAGAVRRRRQAA